MTCRSKAMHTSGECDCLKPADFLELLEREREWFELVLTTMAERRRSHPADVRSLIDYTLAASLMMRLRKLRN